MKNIKKIEYGYLETEVLNRREEERPSLQNFSTEELEKEYKRRNALTRKGIAIAVVIVLLISMIGLILQ